MSHGRKRLNGIEPITRYRQSLLDICLSVACMLEDRCTHMLLTPKEYAIGQSATVQPEAIPLDLAERVEFAKVLGVGAETLTITHAPSLPISSLDDITSYEALTADPIKSMVAGSADYFAQLKVELVLNVVRQRLRGRSHDTLRLLDVGCGPGELMRCLSEHFGHVFGCDPAKSMVRRAGTHALVMPSPTEIPVADSSIDVAICSCVCHHVEPEIRDAHLAEVKRVLRPGGLLLIFEHNPRNPLTQLIVRRCRIDANAHLLPAAHTRKLLDQAGLIDLTTKYYLFFPDRVRAYLQCLEPLLNYTGMGGQYMVCATKPELLK